MLKLARAAEHLQEIRLIDERFASVECKMPFIRDEKRGIGYFEVRLPEPPAAIGPIVGDCLHNLRSVLDYLVWQMVRSNPPNTPSKSNMFPICQSIEAFARQLKGERLAGVPERGVAVIKSLQPFDSPEHPLALLDSLYNADKHRDLNFAVSVASDMDVCYRRNGEVVMRVILGSDEVRNGSMFGGVGVGLELLAPGLQLEAGGTASAFIAFRDHCDRWGEALGVVATLEEIRDLLVDSVVPLLEPFISPSEPPRESA